MAAMALVLPLALGGCGSMDSLGDTLRSDAGWFSKPVTSLFSREDGSGSMGNSKSFSLGPSAACPATASCRC